jgi:hypothetical protein
MENWRRNRNGGGERMSNGKRSEKERIQRNSSSGSWGDKQQ